MTARDERQAPPASPTVLIMLLGRRLREQSEAELHGLGLSIRHMAALGHLANSPGTSYSELARRAGITVQSMQTTLSQLEKLGAVERRSEPGRGRTAQLHVTESGTTLLERAKSVVHAADQRLLDAIGGEHTSLFNQLLFRALVGTRTS